MNSSKADNIFQRIFTRDDNEKSIQSEISGKEEDEEKKEEENEARVLNLIDKLESRRKETANDKKGLLDFWTSRIIQNSIINQTQSEKKISLKRISPNENSSLSCSNIIEIKKCGSTEMNNRIEFGLKKLTRSFRTLDSNDVSMKLERYSNAGIDKSFLDNLKEKLHISDSRPGLESPVTHESIRMFIENENEFVPTAYEDKNSKELEIEFRKAMDDDEIWNDRKKIQIFVSRKFHRERELELSLIV